MKLLFSDATLAGLLANPSARKRHYSDLVQKGLVFELTPSGAYFHFRYTFGGRQRLLSLGKFGDLDVAAARASASEWAHAVLDGIDPVLARSAQQGIPTLNEFITHKYLPHIRTYKSTDINDVSYFKNHILPQFGKRPINEITRASVSEFVSVKIAEGLKPGSINRYLVALRFALNLAVQWETPGLTKNPLHKYPLLKENNLLNRFLNEEETARLKAALRESDNQHLGPIVGLLLVTGARKNEVLKARWEQFDLERRQWRVPKAKSGYHRFIPISDVALRILEERRAIGLDSPWLFPNPTTGEPFVEIYNSWNTARQRAGLETLRIHDLRHSFASALVNGGTPLYEVQKLLGHSSIRTTERYAHLAPERLINTMKISDRVFGDVAKTPLDEGPEQFELFEESG